MTILQISKLIENAKLLIFDSDGVLVEDGKPLPYAKEFVNFQRYTKKKRCVVFSNNSTTDPKKMMNHYQSLGIGIEKIYSSSLLAADYCMREGIKMVFVVGEEGLVNVLNKAGISISETQPEAVIVGMDRTLTYAKLAKATNFLRNGARFIATNPDKSFPTPRGLEPGAGSMIAALIASSDISPEIILGKPNTWGFFNILKQENVEDHQALMIGDRYETDILGAINAKIPCFIVNSGVAAGRINPGKWKDYPKVDVLSSFSDLLDLDN